MILIRAPRKNEGLFDTNARMFKKYHAKNCRLFIGVRFPFNRYQRDSHMNHLLLHTKLTSPTSTNYVLVDVYIDVSSTQFEYGILLLRSFTNLISKLRFRNYLFSTHGYGTPSVYSFEITSQTKENIKEIPNQIINNGIYF